MKSLQRYNKRLNDGSAVFDRRADNLIAFLERVGLDLGSASATLDQRALDSNLGWFDTTIPATVSGQHAATDIHWEKDLDSAWHAAGESGRPVIAYFTFDT